MKFIDQGARQTGTSIMEVLVAMSISLAVTAAKVGLMSNSLQNNSKIIYMSYYFNLMSQDLRRSSYTADAVYCFGNSD